MLRAALLGAVLLLPAGIASAAETVEVPVLEHAVMRGEQLQATDFSIEQRQPAVARGALSIERAKGMEARRNLSAGAVIRAMDVMPVQLVRRGEPVTVRVISGGLTIATAGRALGNGGEGEMVRVVVNSTSRTLDGVVDGTGSVRVSAP